MSTKSIVIGVIIIIIVAVGAYFIFMKGSGPAAGTPATTASSTEQVQGQEIAVGTGAQATPGMQVSVLYVGKLQDGTVFDSSAAHGNQPLVFTLGAQGLIPGFQIGVNGMKVGGERLIAVPPSLGYGANAVHQDPNNPSSPVVIPANSTIVFDVKLVKVEAAPAASSTPAKK
ncbi:FKBP-type peptidyl-prolyl cis-trans isomerase [Candidatus Kaiserbacteria bacterium]|nr:FKBP-type peptidyl-prolyl cis-trans isomerase [Candidatus Kaiserbacteria bacterium]